MDVTTLRFTTFENDGLGEMVSDIVEQDVPTGDRSEARRRIMRRLGFMVDGWLRGEGTSSISLGFRHRFPQSSAPRQEGTQLNVRPLDTAEILRVVVYELDPERGGLSVLDMWEERMHTDPAKRKRQLSRMYRRGLDMDFAAEVRLEIVG